MSDRPRRSIEPGTHLVGGSERKDNAQKAGEASNQQSGPTGEKVSRTPKPPDQRTSHARPERQGAAKAQSGERGLRTPSVPSDRSRGGKDATSARPRDVPPNFRPEKATMARAAEQPYKGGSLTKAGRDYDKHMLKPNRPQGLREVPRNDVNRAGRAEVDRLISNPASVRERTHPDHGAIIDYRDASGRGVRFSRDGNRMIGFLDPSSRPR